MYSSSLLLSILNYEGANHISNFVHNKALSSVSIGMTNYPLKFGGHQSYVWNGWS